MPLLHVEQETSKFTLSLFVYIKGQNMNVTFLMKKPNAHKSVVVALYYCMQ